MDLNLIKKYNVINDKIDIHNPLSIGNGSFVFTCDISGLQTFSEEYNYIPLLTMSEKFAYKKDLGNINLEEYNSYNGKAYYLTSDKEKAKYEALRTNYFKYNMFNLAFYMNDNKININDITNIYQELDLIKGTIYSKFYLLNELVEVESNIDSKEDILNIKVKSNLLNKGLNIKLKSNISYYNKEGSLKDSANIKLDKDIIISDRYRKDIIKYLFNGNIDLKDNIITFRSVDNINLSLKVSDNKYDKGNIKDFFLNTKPYLTGDYEIDRRIILSLYLIRINSCGKYPPAETGLTINGWYNKFHLEMHLWHHLGLIYYGHYKLILPSINYYFAIYEEAKKRAKLNGFLGCRWPKMTDPTGLDSPSPIGPLLMWQQPHLVYMLFIIKELNPDFDLTKYADLIDDTLLCLSSFFVKINNIYYLNYPLIPAQECFDGREVRSPIFEVEYFIHVFKLAQKYNYSKEIYEDIINNAVMPKVLDNCYESHLNTNLTYIEHNYDHPLPIMAYSFFKSERLDKNIIKNSLDKIFKTWDFDKMWGWDFPSISMCLNNLGLKDEALKFIKTNYPKNTYLKNGHNAQIPDDEILPLYLPGNGALIIFIYLFLNGNENEES